MELSIAIVAYNEEKNIANLYSSLSSALSSITADYEIIFIDDGSTDSTLGKIKRLRDKDRKVKLISFTKNFGKGSALAAGLRKASGNVIITMDADMQDNPEEIPKLLNELKKGYDLVVGWKHPRKDPVNKILASKVFNFLVRALTKLNIHDCDSNFRAIKKIVIPHLDIYAGLYRYIPVIAYQNGFKVGEIKVEHLPRLHGKSKYNLIRIYTGIFDLVTIKFLLEYNKRPLHFFGSLGSLFLIFGLVTGSYLLYLKAFLSESIGQRPLLILTILLIFLGIQFLSIGLVGEMIANITQKKKEGYVAREEQGFAK